MTKSTSRLIKKIKSDLLKDDLLLKSNEEFKLKNDKVINNKPFLLTEFVGEHEEGSQVNEGRLILEKIKEADEDDRKYAKKQILVLDDFVEDEKIEQSTPISKPQSNYIKPEEQFSKVRDNFVTELSESDEIYKFDSINEARQFVKNHFKNNLDTWLDTNQNQIDEICKKFLLK
jgi:hypothetical protein